MRTQQFQQHAHTAYLLDAGKLQHVFAHQAVGVLGAPALGLFITRRGWSQQAGFRETVPVEQVGECGIACWWPACCRLGAVFTPFLDRDGVQTYEPKVLRDIDMLAPAKD